MSHATQEIDLLLDKNIPHRCRMVLLDARKDIGSLEIDNVTLRAKVEALESQVESLTAELKMKHLQQEAIQTKVEKLEEKIEEKPVELPSNPPAIVVVDTVVVEPVPPLPTSG